MGKSSATPRKLLEAPMFNVPGDPRRDLRGQPPACRVEWRSIVTQKMTLIYCIIHQMYVIVYIYIVV
jgi:hypothetical protein